MRPVRKGDCPLDEHGNKVAFKRYQDARRYLVERIGPFCSYCEMKLPVGLAVEHIQPKSLHGKNELEWDNLLLACASCNSCKLAKDVNPDNIDEFLWPDKNNTFSALAYSEGGTVRVNPALVSAEERNRAQNLIELVGLDEKHFFSQRTSEKWNDRRKEWDKAMEIKKDLEQNDSEAAREMIVKMIDGYFSIWMTVFSDNPDMRQRILRHFEHFGTAMECFEEVDELIERLR